MTDYLPDYCSYDSSNHLVVDGCRLDELAASFGTPLYVLIENAVRDRARAYLEAIRVYPGASVVAYAGKALLVVSGGELYTALRAGYPAEKVLFHGNNKSAAELRLALEAGVGRIVIDNLSELSLLQNLVQRHVPEEPVNVMLRIIPGVTTHTHHYIETGHADSKFGLDIEHGHATAAVSQLQESDLFQIVGVHVHIGSQILTIEPYRAAVTRAFEFLAELREEHGFVASELDMGGGLGIRYTGDEDPPSIRSYLNTVADMVLSLCHELEYPLPKLIVEPGRSIVGEAGLTVYTVGSTKVVPGVRRFAAVDGGMADNPRPTLYDAVYRAVPANRRPDSAVAERAPLSLVGRFCESGDVIVPELNLGDLQRGDLVAVLSTGAYAYSMASNYNRVTRPAMVLVRDGEAAVIVERETYDDIVRKDRIPDWLG